MVQYLLFLECYSQVAGKKYCIISLVVEVITCKSNEIYHSWPPATRDKFHYFYSWLPQPLVILSNTFCQLHGNLPWFNVLNSAKDALSRQIALFFRALALCGGSGGTCQHCFKTFSAALCYGSKIEVDFWMKKAYQNLMLSKRLTVAAFADASASWFLFLF